MEPLPADFIPEGVGDGLHLGQRCGGEGGDRRIPLEQAFVDRQDPSDLRLVREHLGDQDRVGVTGPPPGQIATVGGVPLEHSALEGPSAAAGDHGRQDLSSRRKLSGADRLYASPCGSGVAFWWRSGRRWRSSSPSSSRRWLALAAAAAVAVVVAAGVAATAAAVVAACTS